ncbi:MAG TPA: N-6 DNA methylase [Sporichthya sp.]|nr:N-6 DNA methylase [Sporichthya sp.]
MTVSVPGGVPSASGPAALDSPALRKARGAFFTPGVLCDYVVAWAIRSATDRVLEPSCGEAAFLLAAGDRLRALGADHPDLHGHELHSSSADAAAAALAATGHRARIGVGDFLATPAQPHFDAVIGNPPYVRYQDFAGSARAAGRRAALRAGVSLTRLASSWAAFTVHAAGFLHPGGRLGLVLPAELLSVNYAADVRSFLMRRFGRVRLVLFHERVFPGVMAEVVLLLAEGEGPASHCELLQVQDLAELSAATGAESTWAPPAAAGKWTAALLPAGARDLYAGLTAGPAFSTLHHWGETTLGSVTGNNRWFALSPHRVAELGLHDTDVLPLSPPGSRHLRGPALTASAWRALGEGGARTWLFRPAGTPSAAAAAYIRAGEGAGVPEAYKCRVRRPWWRVPLVPPADLLLTYMNADRPHLTGNRARVHHLNSVHGVYLRPGLRRAGTELLPLAALNTLTLIGAETVGRAYGGGLLKLEPREADVLPVPSPALLATAAPALRALRPQVGSLLAAGRLHEATDLVDAALLSGVAGVSATDLAHLVMARQILADRRAARGRSAS